MTEADKRMNVTISPRKLKGKLTPPPCKSQLIRAIFCASLTDGESILRRAEMSEDAVAALRCAASLGAHWRFLNDTLTIRGNAAKKESTFDCGESAAVLRFAVPAALAVNGGGVFSGRGRLLERPMTEYIRLFDKLKAQWSFDDVLSVKGELVRDTYEISGEISSQFISGVLLSLPAIGGGSVRIIGDVCSGGYVDMTCEMMKTAGAQIFRADNEILVDGAYTPFEIEIQRDWSNAAFFLAANAMGSNIEIDGLSSVSFQPDRKIIDILEAMSKPGYAQINISQTPDLLPPLALYASVREGITEFIGAKNLRYKESDRLSAVSDILGTLGADIRQAEDGLTVTGKAGLTGGTVHSHNDHRMAMMAAVAATVCSKEVIISGAECVAKSYPGFFEDYLRLGGDGSVTVYGE